MPEKDNIILIGLPGAGKSTLGIVLAKILNYSFVDADLLIQNHMGKRLQGIIDERGAQGFIDVENREMLALGKRKLTDVVLAWLRKIESCGMMAGVYSFRAAFSSYLYDGELAAYPHWVASWTKTCSFRPMGIWQFGGETNLIRSNQVAGVVCDQDYLLEDYPARIKAAGKNGFSAESGGAPSSGGGDTCSVTLPKLRQGANSGYVKTAQLLLNAYFDAGLAVDGGFGPKTYAAVVAYQRSRGLAVDGVIGAQTWRQLLC